MLQGVVHQDADGKIISMNRAAVRILGKTPEEFLGETSVSVEHDTIREDGCPFPGLEHPAMVSLRTGKTVTDVVMGVFNPREKKYRWINITAIPLFKNSDGRPFQVYTVFEDITERKADSEALRNTRNYLESLFDYANAPIIVWDPNSAITRFNHAFEHMTGYQAEDVIGKDLSMLFPPATRESTLVKINQTLEGQQWESTEIPILRRDGSTRLALWSSANIYSKDGKTLIATIAQGQDITDRKEAETRLKEYSERLARSNMELQRFAYVASHDLREPLRTISGFLQIISMDYGDKLDDVAKDYIARAVGASERLHKMIDDLLSFSRLETKKKEFARVDLTDVMTTVKNDLEKSIAEHRATITVEPLPEVLADNQQMTILFRNLVDNGVKFHGKDPPVVRITTQRKEDEWVFSVQDNGIGIEPTNYSKIFGMFTRLHPWKEYPGNGIGLSMCKKIVERHGGRIWVESVMGEGTSFFFTLPIRKFPPSPCKTGTDGGQNPGEHVPEHLPAKRQREKSGHKDPG